MANPPIMQEPKKSARSKRIKGGGVILVCIVVIIVIAVVISVVTKKKHSNDNATSGFNKDFSITWAKNHTRVSNHGKRLELILDNVSGTQSAPSFGTELFLDLEILGNKIGFSWTVIKNSLNFDFTTLAPFMVGDLMARARKADIAIVLQRFCMH